jgi:ADP-heptose:LPS heptosyltransferase
VLVVRCDHIGDAVMATAVLRPLREALRPATLDVLAALGRQGVEGHPAVDHVLTYATPWWSAVRARRRGNDSLDGWNCPA